MEIGKKKAPPSRVFRHYQTGEVGRGRRGREAGTDAEKARLESLNFRAKWDVTFGNICV